MSSLAFPITMTLAAGLLCMHCKESNPSDPNYYINDEYTDDKGEPTAKLLSIINEIENPKVKSLILEGAMNEIKTDTDCNTLMERVFKRVGMTFTSPASRTCFTPPADQRGNGFTYFYKDYAKDLANPVQDLLSPGDGFRPQAGDLLHWGLKDQNLILVVDPERCIYFTHTSYYYDVKSNKQIMVQGSRFSNLGSDPDKPCTDGIWKSIVGKKTPQTRFNFLIRHDDFKNRITGQCPIEAPFP